MNLIIIGLILLAVFGEPLFIVIGGAAFACFYFLLNVSPSTLFTDFYRLSTMPILIAIPLFIFSGYMLAEGRVPQKMLRFANALLGWAPSGLVLVALVACSVFTAFTGASAITIVAVGALVYPALIKSGYSEKFTLGLVTVSGSLGTLLIPCLPLIIYGVIASQQSPLNVEDMFVAGIIPNILLVILLWIYAFFAAPKSQAPQKFSWSELGSATWSIKWELPLPIIVVGGILSGLITAAEAAAVTVIYILIIEMFINKDLNLTKLIQIIRRSMIMNGAVKIILGMALGLTDVFVNLSLPDKLFTLISANVHDKHTFLLLLNIFILFVGCSMDIFSACLVVVPIIVPIAVKYHIHPVHLGIIFLTNMELGFLAPPMGISLFISSLKFNKSLPTILKSVIPFFLVMLIGLLLITYVPQLSLYLLRFKSQGTLIDPASLF